MRVDTLLPLTARAEYWDFTETQNPDTNELFREYHKAADIKLMVTETQGVQLAFARELMVFNGQLRNIVDPQGNKILDVSGEGKYIFLGTGVAQFDVFGNVMGYKYTLTKGVPVGG